MISHERRDVSDRLLPTTTCLPVPALSVSDRSVHPGKNGAIEGSVVSRRAGSASAGLAVTRRGIRPHAWSKVLLTLDRGALSRDLHDFASDVPSTLGTRFRHFRTACVRPEGSRPFPPPLVKETAYRDPRRLRSDGTPLFARSGFPKSSCDGLRLSTLC